MSEFTKPPMGSDGKIVAVLNRLSEQEAKYVLTLSNALNALDYYIGTFEAAVELFDKFWDEQKQSDSTGIHYETSLSRRSQWKIILARDGAITIYHIGTLISSVMQTVHNLPSLASYINKTMLRSAKKEFFSEFPKLTKIRHAVGHGPELFKDSNASSKNMFSGKFKNEHFDIEHDNFGGIDLLSHCCYGTTINGEFLTYDISNESLQKLQTLQRSIDNALGPLGCPIRRIREASNDRPS